MINSLQINQLTCSCGHSACAIFYGHYNRSIKIKDHSIQLNVQRIKCNCCNATHALLPSSMVPYSQVLLQDQVDIIKLYEITMDYTNFLSVNLSIDENCIRSIIRRYIQHWLQRITSAKVTLSMTLNFIKSCFLNFGRQFMQIKKTLNILFCNTNITLHDSLSKTSYTEENTKGGFTYDQ